MVEEILAVRCGRILTPSREISNGVILVQGSKIVSLGVNGELTVPQDAKTLNFEDKIAVPGFLDIHIHGGGGHDVMEASEEATISLALFASRHGVTSLLPSTVSAPHNSLLKVVRILGEMVGRETGGAEVLGINLEGPYINPKMRGAHNYKHIRPPSVGEFKDLWKMSGEQLKIVTQAPELEGAEKLLAELRKLGVVAAVGHSDATYSEVLEAVSLGLSHVTHIFNGMRGFHHREPGAVGAALLSDKLTAEVISDNIHVHPEAVRLLTKVKDPSLIVLVTDSIMAAGMPDGEYRLGSRRVTVKNGVCRLKSGSLAGSTLTMDVAIRNTMQATGLPLQVVLGMATVNPARVIGVHDRKGSLAPGKDADITIIDSEVNIYATMVKGKMVYRKGLLG
ncbi:MAG: N-acetylglucosamine-6-phosphate deacetylase [Candidatus Jordarchaeaceae archaeon]